MDVSSSETRRDIDEVFQGSQFVHRQALPYKEHLDWPREP